MKRKQARQLRANSKNKINKHSKFKPSQYIRKEDSNGLGKIQAHQTQWKLFYKIQAHQTQWNQNKQEWLPNLKIFAANLPSRK